MHFVEGLTGEEIGERLGISRATVVRWPSTARTFLLRETARSRLDLSLSVLLASESR